MPSFLNAILMRILLLVTFALLAVPSFLAAQFSKFPGKKERQQVLLSSWQPPKNRRCLIPEAPKQLPDVETIIDAPSFSAAMESVDLSNDSLLVSLEYDQSGNPSIQVVLEGSRSQTQSDLLALLPRYLRSNPALATTALRFRIRGVAPHLQVGRREVCPAELAYPHEFQMSVYEVASQITGNTTTRLRTGVLARITADGKVIDVRPFKSSGNAQFDQFIENLVRRSLFVPALVDHLPAAAWQLIPAYYPN
jgi:hypothetical protein